VSQKRSIDWITGDELLQVHRLRDVAVGVQVVAPQDILFRLRRGEDHDRDRAQLGVRLDLREHLAPVLLRQIQVEEHDVGPRHILVLAALVEEIQRLDAVLGPMQVVIDLAFAQGFLREAVVARVVLDEKYLHGGRLCMRESHGLFPSSALGLLQASRAKIEHFWGW
jgi:hypothetical protein